MKNLNHRQHQFALFYDGNGTETCRRAGYKGSDNVLAVQARRLLRNAHVLEIIENRNKKTKDGYIADRETRQQFWSEIMLDADQDMPVRLKASEILGKSCGDFITKLEHSQSFSFANLLEEITLDDDPLIRVDNDTEPLKIGE